MVKEPRLTKVGLKPLWLGLILLIAVLAGQLARMNRPATTPPAPELTPAAVNYWQEQFPAQVASYLHTLRMEPTKYAGSVPYQKLERYPFMRAMYHGFGFWFDFREFRGHMFAVEDTMITGRAKFGGVCWG